MEVTVTLPTPKTYPSLRQGSRSIPFNVSVFQGMYTVRKDSLRKRKGKEIASDLFSCKF